MDKLTKEEVDHIAHLARIGMSDSEREIFQVELKKLLDEVKKILKTHAGERLVTSFNQAGVGMPVVPVKLPAGGIVFFVINVESSHKY